MNKPKARFPALRWFLAGAAAALLLVIAVWALLAYQQPDLLLQMSNLRYCG